VGLLLAAAIFALLYGLNAIIQTIRRQPRIGFTQTLFAFLVVLLPLAALIGNHLETEPLALLRTLALGIAAGIALLSLIVMLLELRRPERLKGSRGLLGIGAGLLVAISTFTVPLIADYAFSAVPTATLPIVLASSAERTDEPVGERPTATLTRTPTPTLTATATPTRRPQATPTMTATRFQFATRTPHPTATLPNPCLALANFNVNLRARPEGDADVLTVIPYNNTVMLFGRNDDSTWWYGDYDGEAGWVNGEFLTLSASCDGLPERPIS
jgi:hypothetical protein